MDPDAALKNLRDALATVREKVDGPLGERDSELGGDYWEALDAANTAVDAFEALDGWIKGSGSLPADWRKNRKD
jgi:hypothetical protein